MRTNTNLGKTTIALAVAAFAARTGRAGNAPRRTIPRHPRRSTHRTAAPGCAR